MLIGGKVKYLYICKKIIMEINKNVSACVVLINPEGLILAVSRKYDHTLMGLPGGKMEPEDNNEPMLTAIRECREETGLNLHSLKLIFAIHKSGNMGYTYLAEYNGEINHNEPHLVKWVPMQALINGSFGKYNQLVSESLTDMGIEFTMKADIKAMKKEVENFVNEYYKNNQIKFSYLRNDDGYYSLHLEHLEGYELEESMPNDTVLNKGLHEIGLKYYTKIYLDLGYYGK